MSLSQSKIIDPASLASFPRANFPEQKIAFRSLAVPPHFGIMNQELTNKETDKLDKSSSQEESLELQ